MHSLLYWISWTEISAFILALIFWIKLIDQMGVVLLFLPHIVRGAVGLLIGRKMPRSHHIVKDIDLGDQIGFDNIKEAVRISSQNQFVEIAENIQTLLNAYFALTILSLGLDFIVLVSILVSFGNPGEEDNEMILLLLFVINIVCTIQWLSFAF